MQPDHETETETETVKRGRDGRRMNPASLANLQPGAGAGRVGQAPALRHGARSHSPQRSPEWSPAVEQAARELSGQVPAELVDDAGELLPWARPSVESLAVLLVAMRRVERWTADREARGKYTGEDDERVAKVTRAYRAALSEEALTLQSRLAALGQALDVAVVMSQRTAADDAERKREAGR